MPKPNKKLEIIQLLRVLGALGVAWFHFTNGNVSFLDEGWLKNSGKYGWLGVEVFFVISGFVVPYSLWYCKFQFQRDWDRFFVRRILRLHPAYIVSILVSIGLWYISSLIPGFKGQPYEIDVVNLMLHIGYLNGIFNQSWINPVFWTLGIEIQYYFLAMAVYPFVYSVNSAVKYPFLLLMYLLPFVFNQDNIIFHWLYIYIYGTLSFCLYTNQLSKKEYFILLLVTILLSNYSLGTLMTLVSSLTSIVIVFLSIPKIQVIDFFANLSYSFYLIHVPVGGRAINLGTRLGSDLYLKFIVLGVALISSVYAAFLLYKFVEFPCQTWSKKLQTNK